jgi:signal transduction histidine kinase
MRLSLHARVALLALVMVAAVCLINVRAVVAIVEGVVADNIDVKLDTQILVIEHAIDAQGRLDPQKFASFQDLAAPPFGWGWDVRSAAGHWHQGLTVGPVYYPVPHFHVDQGIYSGRGFATSGQEIHVRRVDFVRAGAPASVILVGPRDLIDRELVRVRSEMYKTAAEVVIVLAATLLLQVRVGLQPLRKLVRDVTRVRSGEAASLPEEQPSDLKPLASEINALIERNNAGLETARIHAANLAHAVKTPLASLMLQLEYEGASREVQDLVGHLSERVAHHLHRARGAAEGSGGTRHADIGQALDEIRATMAVIHRDHPIAIDALVPPRCTVAVEAEDLGEMIGNLVDNACRFARTRVTVAAEQAGRRIAITIEDDGPGIADDRLADAMRPGVRLDEAGMGYGLGLAIVRELAELYGGTLALAASPRLGGLCATLDLPR